MDKRAIIDIVLSIINANNKYSSVVITYDDIHKELLGHEVGLFPRMLLMLFFDIEKEFGITITDAAIIKNGFHTISQIADVVLESLETI